MTKKTTRDLSHEEREVMEAFGYSEEQWREADALLSTEPVRASAELPSAPPRAGEMSEDERRVMEAFGFTEAEWRAS